MVRQALVPGLFPAYLNDGGSYQRLTTAGLIANTNPTITLFPADTITYTEGTGLISSHVLPFPSTTAAGDLVRVCVAFNSNSTVTDPTGWAVLVSKVNNDTFRIYAKIVDAADVLVGAVTVVLSAPQRSSAVIERITGARNGVTSSEIAVSSAVDESTATPNPPSLNPGWGTEEILYSAVTFSSDGNFTFNLFPTNYNLGHNNIQVSSGNGNGVSIASRLITAASEDPDIFTTVTSRTRSTYTMAVRKFVASGIAPSFYGMIF